MGRTRARTAGLAAVLALALAGATTPAGGAQALERQSPRHELVHEARAADSHCVTVVRDGRTLLSRDLAREIEVSAAWSVTKSVTSLLVGIAADRGLLDLDDRVARWVPAWRGTASRKVTVRQLLANTSGRQWGFRLDYVRMAARAPNKTRFAIRLGQEAPPGSTWVYNNSAIQVLERVLERATGRTVPELADRHLFGPLGMRSTRFQLDAAGNAMVFAGLLTTCRDLARLGTMLADRGRFAGRRLVSGGYWRDATQGPGSPHNAAYGLLFWVNEPGPLLPAVPAPAGTPVAQGPLVPEADDDAFWALGLHQQYVFVSPRSGVVAVRLGGPPPADAPLTLRRFTELSLAVADQDARGSGAG